MPETSKSGVWVDTRTNKVVHSQPEEGRQLVVPGGEITPAVQQVIDADRSANETTKAPVRRETSKG